MKKIVLVLFVLTLLATAVSALDSCNVACGDTIYNSCQMEADLDCSGGSPTNWAIRIRGEGITVDGNGYSITGNGTGDSLIGISIDNDDVVVEGFEISSIEIGIRTYDGNDAVIRENEMHDVLRGVYVVHSDGVNVINNTIYDTEEAGIKFASGASNGYVYWNAISKSEKYGILIEDGVEGHEDHVIEHNDLYNNSWAGIKVYSGEGITINHNWVSGNNNGIDIAGNDVFVFANGVEENNQTGIYFRSGAENNTAFMNIISNNPSAHDLTNYGDGTTVAANYYSEFDSGAEGCSNSNGDPFCDSAFEKDDAPCYGTFSDNAPVDDDDFILGAVGPNGGGTHCV